MTYAKDYVFNRFKQFVTIMCDQLDNAKGGLVYNKFDKWHS